MSAELFPHLTLLLDQAYDGPLNMAIDQALLETTQVPVLRVYQWGQPSISIGYSHDLGALKPSLQDRWPVVRRWTGGGVVWHDADSTYSVIVPSREPWAATRPVESYRLLHGSMADCLKANRDIDCRLAGEDDQKEGALCFEAPALFDIVAGSEKIAGAGQRRTREGLLHQGSVNLMLNESFWSAWAQSLAADVTVQRTLSSEVMSRAENLVRERYGQQEWLHRQRRA
ncbi:MAG: lipoate--protein ligase family protein [Verrucomicrobiaceae bacterium]